jgi:hypothetical protein
MFYETLGKLPISMCHRFFSVKWKFYLLYGDVVRIKKQC